MNRSKSVLRNGLRLSSPPTEIPYQRGSYEGRKDAGRLRHGVPKALFETRTAPTALFDVTRDGKRFLMLTAAEQEPSALMTVVVNWHAGVRK